MRHMFTCWCNASWFDSLLCFRVGELMSSANAHNRLQLSCALPGTPYNLQHTFSTLIVLVMFVIQSRPSIDQFATRLCTHLTLAFQYLPWSPPAKQRC